MMRSAVVFGIVVSCWLPWAGAADPSGGDDLAKAVAVMRKIPAATLTGEQQQVKGQELDAAWKTLTDAGPKGAAVLKEELRKIDASKEKDDFFKLGAATLLWQIGKAGEAETIATIWSGSVDFSANYQYVFFTAFEAARTQDPRVLPMLVAVLRDQKGKAFIPAHSLDVEWPLSHVFVWGAFGSKGVPALERVLEESKNETALASAIFLLAADQDLKSLAKIRALALQGTGAARSEAIKALGTFGHPQDFDFLMAGLKGKNPAEVWASAYALYEYEDLRAVPQLIPFLSVEDKRLAGEAIGCLSRLVTPEGIEAIQQCARTTADKEKGEACKGLVASMLKAADLTYEAYASKTPAEKTKVAASLRGKMEEKYRLKPGDRNLTHDELLKAAAEWTKDKRITAEKYSWVEDRHLMAAATAGDIPLLLDVAAACYSRLSDECLYETRTLQDLIRRLGRGRYRREVGLCERVELAQEPKK
jgi:HEAT repeat protein